MVGWALMTRKQIEWALTWLLGRTSAKKSSRVRSTNGTRKGKTKFWIRTSKCQANQTWWACKTDSHRPGWAAMLAPSVCWLTLTHNEWLVRLLTMVLRRKAAAKGTSMEQRHYFSNKRKMSKVDRLFLKMGSTKLCQCPHLRQTSKSSLKMKPILTEMTRETNLWRLHHNKLIWLNSS